LDDYDEIDENQRKYLYHIISGYKKVPNQNTANEVSSNQAIVQRAPLASINTSSSSISHLHEQQPMGFNLGFQPVGFPGFQPNFASQYRMAAFSTCASSSPVPTQNYTGCTINYFPKDAESPQPQKKRRAYIIESDDED
jgi:hypothetical protein